MKILLLEDESKIRRVLTRGLNQEKYDVLEARDAQDAIYHINYSKFDLAIFDRMVPGVEDSTELISAMRSKGNQTPVLILTAKDSIEQKIEGLDLGADDYLVKPFNFDELLARVRALLRRPENFLDEKLTCGEITIDSKNYLVERMGKNIELSNKEFKLLEYFIRNQKQVLSKDQIIASVWKDEAEVMPNNVEAFVKSLRNKLEKPFGSKSKKYIHTKRGFGYIFQEGS